MVTGDPPTGKGELIEAIGTSGVTLEDPATQGIEVGLHHSQNRLEGVSNIHSTFEFICFL